VLQQFAVTDTETTGLDEDDQIVELGLALSEWDPAARALSLVSTFSSLVRPTVPVKPDARANHHITDAQLARAKAARQVVDRAPYLSPEVIVVGHNLEFDVRMLAQSGVVDYVAPHRKLDTYRLALHAWPDSPSHKNQVLRYYLEIAVPGPWDKQPAHRAMPDVMVTLGILERLLQWRPVEDLLRLTETPVLLKTCNIGAWRGKPWASVDMGMLRWILNRDFSEDVKHTARHYLNRRAA
jgi:exodeoxyribonuclease X